MTIRITTKTGRTARERGKVWAAYQATPGPTWTAASGWTVDVRFYGVTQADEAYAPPSVALSMSVAEARALAKSLLDCIERAERAGSNP